MAPSTGVRSPGEMVALVAALAVGLALGACDGPAGSGASSGGPTGPSSSPTAATASTGSGDALAPASGTAADSAVASGAPSADPAMPSSGSARGPGAEPSAAAGTTSASAAVAEGPAQGNDAYSSWLQASGKYTAGVPGTVQAVLVAKPGYKCNEKYPYKFKLDPAPAGISYPATTVKGISYGTGRSTLSIPFVPEKAGGYTVSGIFWLSVCNETTCKIQKQPLSVQITVASGS